MSSNWKRKLSHNSDNHNYDDCQHLSTSKKFKSTSKNDDDIDSDEGCYGPKIPTQPSKKNESSSPCNENNKKQTSNISNNFIGPVIPCNYIKKDQLENDDGGFTQNFGYSSEITRNNGRKSNRHDDEDGESFGVDEKNIENKTAEEDDDVYGPRPPPKNSGDNQNGDGKTAVDDVINEIEKRSMLMKKKLLGLEQPAESSKSTKREDWMTQLPPQFSKCFGVTARKFSTSLNRGGGAGGSGEDRSGWTDTPEDRERKLKNGATSGKHSGRNDDDSEPTPHDLMIMRKNEQYRKFVEEHNEMTKRNKSLLEMHKEKRRKGKNKRRSPSSSSSSSEEEKRKKHKKKLKKDKKSSGDAAKKEKNPKDKNSKDKNSKDKNSKGSSTQQATRRPFDRDVDLQVNRMTLGQKRAFIEKSKVLNSKFGHGKSQFL